MSAEDEWMFDKSLGLLDAGPEEYKAVTGYNSAAEIFSDKLDKFGILELNALYKEIYLSPKSKDDYLLKVKGKRLLSLKEVELIFKAIEEYDLIAEMFIANQFGGYGMDLYEHEVYPGAGAMFVFRITEYDLPVEMNSKNGKPSKGTRSNQAWDLFSKYTHSIKNKEWLAKYGLDSSREQSHYDY